MNVVKKLHGSMRFPTSIIVKGANVLGVEIARSLLEQGGYVIIIDSESNASRKLLDPLIQYKNLTVLNFSAINTLGQDLRRLDYVFYFEHKSTELKERISSQKYLQTSNYLDSILDLCSKFDAKFLLTTSIRAHQLNISNAQLDYNYGLNNNSNHAEYMELEIQRYSESLVQEYKEKVGINSRILRLGEIIGRGTEFDQNSSLIKLIRDGLEGKDLKVPGDGLEANYYIHYLDAAYGVLKAQFSASSKGKIFTLANPEEITVLSISYKLLELIPTAREIRFDSDDDQFPPLVLYKPAESLINIGWKPRIEFDRSLVQTIEYVQELLIIEKALKEDESIAVSSTKNMSDKIKDFFFVAENEPDENDAISKLISERKKLEMARTGNMIQANVTRKTSSSRKEKLNPVQKTDVFLHDLLFGFSKRISFLKNVTLTDFLVTMLLFIGFATVYFLLISPLFSLSKNIFLVRLTYDKTIESVRTLDFDTARSQNKNLTENLESAQKRVEDLQYLFSMSGQDDLYSNTHRYIESPIEYSQGYEDIFSAYVPMIKIVDDFKPNIVYRFGEERLLSSDDKNNFKPELDEIFQKRGIIEDSLNRINTAKVESGIYSEKLPNRFVGNMMTKRDELDEMFENNMFVANNYNHWPLLLGKDKPVNYLVIVQDNTRYSSAGGAVTGYLYFTLEQGTLKSVNAEVVQTSNFNKEIITNEVISSINLVSSKEVDMNNIEFVDLYNISDPALFIRTIKSQFETTKKVNIDIALTTNIATLTKSLQSGYSVDYQQVDFNDDNILNNINLLNSDNKVEERNEIIMNVYAKHVADRFNGLRGIVTELVSVMGSSQTNSDVIYYSDNPELENFIRSISGVSYSPTAQIDFGMNADSITKSTIFKYPILTISGDVSITKDYNGTTDLGLKLNNPENLQNGYLCVSGGAQDLENYDVTPDLVSTAFSDDKICNIFLPDDDQTYGLKYNTTQFANVETKQVVYMLRLNKNPGIDSNYDIKFSFDPGLQVLPEDTNFILEDNKYVYSGILSSEKIFKFELSK